MESHNLDAIAAQYMAVFYAVEHAVPRMNSVRLAQSTAVVSVLMKSRAHSTNIALRLILCMVAVPMVAPMAASAATNSCMALGLSFSTFFGGSGYERAQGVAVDKDDFIYIVGNTSSSDLPTTPGAFQRTYRGDNVNGSSGDGFVAKFTRDGSRLVWATYLGGTAATAFIMSWWTMRVVRTWRCGLRRPISPPRREPSTRRGWRSALG